MLSHQEDFSIAKPSVFSSEFSTQKTARGGIAIVGIYIKDQVTFSHSKRSFFVNNPQSFVLTTFSFTVCLDTHEID